MTAYKVDKRSRLLNNNSDSYEFTSANKLFTAKELQVRKCLLDLFGEELETMVRSPFIRSRNVDSDIHTGFVKYYILPSRTILLTLQTATFVP